MIEENYGGGVVENPCEGREVGVTEPERRQEDPFRFIVGGGTRGTEMWTGRG